MDNRIPLFGKKFNDWRNRKSMTILMFNGILMDNRIPLNENHWYSIMFSIVNGVQWNTSMDNGDFVVYGNR